MTILFSIVAICFWALTIWSFFAVGDSTAIAVFVTLALGFTYATWIVKEMDL